MNKKPEMTYGEAPDMTVYQRKEGDRLLIYVDKEWRGFDTIYRVLMQYNAEKYIDFATIYDPTQRTKDICTRLGISFITYDEYVPGLFYNMINNSKPTRAAIFYDDITPTINQLIYILDTKNIRFDVFR